MAEGVALEIMAKGSLEWGDPGQDRGSGGQKVRLSISLIPGFSNMDVLKCLPRTMEVGVWSNRYAGCVKTFYNANKEIPKPPFTKAWHTPCTYSTTSDSRSPE